MKKNSRLKYEAPLILPKSVEKVKIFENTQTKRVFEEVCPLQSINISLKNDIRL